MYMYLQSATQKVSVSLHGENPDVMKNDTKYSRYTYFRKTAKTFKFIFVRNERSNIFKLNI